MLVLSVLGLAALFLFVVLVAVQLAPELFTRVQIFFSFAQLVVRLRSIYVLINACCRSLIARLLCMFFVVSNTGADRCAECGVA